MLRRKIQSVLQDYFQSDSNKILLLDGARQIGKSFIIRYEGRRFFKNYIEINFLEDKNGGRLFENISTTKGEVDFIVDDYDTLSALPIEVKSGNDFKRHRALDKFVQNKDYGIDNAILFSNSRDVQRVGKIIYMPIYYVMFLEPSMPEEVFIN